MFEWTDLAPAVKEVRKATKEGSVFKHLRLFRGGSFFCDRLLPGTMSRKSRVLCSCRRRKALGLRSVCEAGLTSLSFSRWLGVCEEVVKSRSRRDEG